MFIGHWNFIVLRRRGGAPFKMVDQIFTKLHCGYKSLVPVISVEVIRALDFCPAALQNHAHNVAIGLIRQILSRLT